MTMDESDKTSENQEDSHDKATESIPAVEDPRDPETEDGNESEHPSATTDNDLKTSDLPEESFDAEEANTSTAPPSSSELLPKESDIVVPPPEPEHEPVPVPVEDTVNVPVGQDDDNNTSPTATVVAAEAETFVELALDAPESAPNTTEPPEPTTANTHVDEVDELLSLSTMEENDKAVVDVETGTDTLVVEEEVKKPILPSRGFRAQICKSEIRCVRVCLRYFRPVEDCWKDFSNGFRRSICDWVLSITHRAAVHPIKYLVGITVISFALLGIGLATNFDMSVSAEASYTSQKSVLRVRKEWVNQISGFPPQPISIRTVIHANGESVLSQKGVQHAFEIVEAVTHTNGYERVCNPKHRYHINHHPHEDDYVGGYSTECHVRGITLLWNNSLSVMQKQVKNDGDVWIAVGAEKYPDGSEVDTREILGRPRHHYEDISGAESLLMEVLIPGMYAHSEELKEEVLKRLLELREEWEDYESESQGLRMEVFANSEMEQETTRAVMKDLPLIAFVFVIMGIFTCTIFSSNTTRSEGNPKSSSRVLLGLGAVFTVVLCLASSYGLLYIIGVPFTSLTQILPFVMFGIGLDDAFIIFGEFNRTDRRKDPVARIHDTFEEIGLSIVLTKATTTIAFALGCCSDVPTLYWLSLYAFPTVIVDALYQLTFFVAVMVLDERRIQANRKDCCFCFAYDRKDPLDELSLASSLASSSSTPISSNMNKIEDSVDDLSDQDMLLGTRSYEQPRSRVDRLMGWYANQLIRPVVKTNVLWVFLIMTVGLAYSATKFTQEFNVMEMLPADSFIKDYLNAMENHGERGWIIPSAYFSGVDQGDPSIQDQMEAYINDLASMDSMTEQPPFFWLRHFRDFLTYDDRLLDLSFNQQMDIFLSIDHFKTLYGDHIMRDSETGNVVASRCVLYMDTVDLHSVQNQIDAWEELRSVTKMQPINGGSNEKEQKFFLYEENMFYIWEFYTGTVGELVANSILGVLVVCMIALSLIPHWTATLYMFPLISFLYIDMIGFLQLFQCHLNAVSYFSLIMSIGLLVDFNMHILLRYYESPCTTREGKVKDALQTMGSSVLIGGFSTFLGVLPLFLSSSELMRTLFYGFIGMVLLGCSHGLILLPVILSIIGPLTVDAIGTTKGRLNRRKMTEQLSSVDSEQSFPAGSSTSSTCSKTQTLPSESLYNSTPANSDRTLLALEGDDSHGDVVESALGAFRWEEDQSAERDYDTAAAEIEQGQGALEAMDEAPNDKPSERQVEALAALAALEISEGLKSTLDDCVLLPTETNPEAQSSNLKEEDAPHDGPTCQNAQPRTVEDETGDCLGEEDTAGGEGGSSPCEFQVATDLTDNETQSEATDAVRISPSSSRQELAPNSQAQTTASSEREDDSNNEVAASTESGIPPADSGLQSGETTTDSKHEDGCEEENVLPVVDDDGEQSCEVVLVPRTEA